jgi:hypothetical protein
LASISHPNGQAKRYAKEGVPISLSTLADQVGGCTAALTPLFKRLEAYVLSAERLHGEDTRVPVLAKGKTDAGWIWVYMRDDKPFGGQAPPGAVFYYSRDRAGEHPQAHLASYTGIFQADAYGSPELCDARARRHHEERAPRVDPTRPLPESGRASPAARKACHS